MTRQLFKMNFVLFPFPVSGLYQNPPYGVTLISFFDAETQRSDALTPVPVSGLCKNSPDEVELVGFSHRRNTGISCVATNT